MLGEMHGTKRYYIYRYGVSLVQLGFVLDGHLTRKLHKLLIINRGHFFFSTPNIFTSANQ